MAPKGPQSRSLVLSIEREARYAIKRTNLYLFGGDGFDFPEKHSFWVWVFFSAGNSVITERRRGEGRKARLFLLEIYRLTWGMGEIICKFIGA